MSDIIHRKAPRINERMPLVVEHQGELVLDAEHCVSENLSASGICFSTRVPRKVRQIVDIILVMPFELTGREETPVRYKAKVLRVLPIGASQKYKVAAKFLSVTNVLQVVGAFFTVSNRRRNIA
jgi:hypothetical protein